MRAWSLLGVVAHAAWLRRRLPEGPCAFTVFNDLSPDRGRTLSPAGAAGSQLSPSRSPTLFFFTISSRYCSCQVLELVVIEVHEL